jgi:tight adherence protein B
MTRPVRRVTSTVLGLLLGLASFALLAAAPASAADGAVIDHAQPTKGAVKLLVSVPGTDPVDYDHVSTTINGTAADSEAVAASTANVERTSILAIDTSRSMKGTRITEAKKAALAYLASVPDNVKVGVVSFDDTVKTDVAPTLDRAAATKAINGLSLTLNTALYDGVMGAIKAAGPGGASSGQRKLLVLSDGKDTTNTNLSDVLDSIKESGVNVDVVSLQKGEDANQPLNAMASAGKGKVFTTADPATLSAAFASEANALARQIVVTAQVPAGFDQTSSNVEVTVPTGTQTFTASAYVPVRTAADIAAVPTAIALRPALLRRPPVPLRNTSEPPGRTRSSASLATRNASQT